MAEIGTEIVSTVSPEEEAPLATPERTTPEAGETPTEIGQTKPEVGQATPEADMGNCCSAVCGGKREDGEDEERSWLLGKGGKSEELPDKYEWEQNVMVQNVMKSGKISHAAIVSLSNGELRAVGPKNFRPHKNAIRNILKALKGDTAGIAEDGIVLGGGTNVCTPGKLEEGKAIYGSDGKGGGCSIFQTKETVLICVYNSDAAVATRLAAEVAEYITDEGGR